MDYLPQRVLVSFKGQHILIDFNGKTMDLRRRIFEKLSLESQLSSHFEIYLDRDGTVFAEAEIPLEIKKVYLREVDGIPKQGENIFHVHFLEFNSMDQLKGVTCSFLEKLSKETLKNELSKMVKGRNVSENFIMNGRPVYNDWQLDGLIDMTYPYLVEVSELKMMESIPLNPVKEKPKKGKKKGMEKIRNLYNLLDGVNID